ncbi:MAG: putative minor capsid protein [Eubacteriales bacterium]|nr:putative minor capsid protein [Eubacteriales bacterium]
MRPIPRALLIHTATLLTGASDAWQSGESAPLAQLRYVRVEPRAAQTRTRDDTRAEPAALLLYDARHSLPPNVAFTPGQFVLFQGVRYSVDTVEALYDGRRMHHVELTLGS